MVDFNKYWEAWEVKDWGLYHEFIQEIIELEQKADLADFYKKALLDHEDINSQANLKNKD